ncbi:MAG: MFS transporter [Piscinibacter sp.]|nr:MFS transporter [Piscinibacter sp.]
MMPLATLLSGVGLLVLGVGLLFSVLGLRAGLAEFSTVTTGIVMSAYFVGFVVGTLYCPVLIRRVGHIRSFAAMASVASTMPILHALWVEPWYWAALRLVTGTCLVGLYIVVESWLNVLAPREQRGKVFALYLTVSCVAMALGQWLLLVGDRLGFVPFVIVSVLLSFALLPLTLTPVAEPEPVEAPHLGLAQLYRTSPLGVSGAFTAGLLSGALLGLGAVFVQRLGLSDAAVAAFMAATILGGALFQWPIGHLSDRHDRRRVLFAVCAGTAVVAAGTFAALRMAPAALIPAGIVLGGLLFAIYGLSVAHVNDLIDPSRVLEVTGGLLLVHGIGASIGPTLAGIVMNLLGPGSLLVYFAVATALQALYTLHRMRYAAPVPAEAKAGYVVMGGSSQATLQLDPRATRPPEP